MKDVRSTCFTGVVLVAAIALGGCQRVGDWLKTGKSRFFDPASAVKAPLRSPVNPILETAGYADERDQLPPNATFPTERDLVYTEEDYVIGPRDVLDLSVLDLFADGVETTLRREVEDSGYIDLPLIDEPLLAEGKTREQLKQAIADAYSPQVLLDPVVSVTVLVRRQSTFSIFGSIRSPGTYQITRRDMRLLEALTTAGGVIASNLNYVYVIRSGPGIAGEFVERRRGDGQRSPDTGGIPELPELPTTDTAPATQESETRPSDDVEEALEELRRATPGAAPGVRSPSLAAVGAGPAAPPGEEPDESLSSTRKWIYTAEGEWVQVDQQAPPATQPSGEGAPRVRPLGEPARAQPGESDPFGWGELEMRERNRIIAINLGKLRDGDPRMNIVIRDRDIVRVPSPTVGEFYVMGEVVRPGVYTLTGRAITVKQAVAAAGNLGALSWPENSILVRRVGGNQEQIIPLDIEAIIRGNEPDLFVKPNDVIAVGTDVRAPFYAVIRNAFRFSYGFGFLYDRNFATGAPSGLNSERFSRW